MMMRSQHVRGFSLIEMMVVIALFSIVAAFSVPKFIKHRSKMRRGECHRTLTHLYEAEKKYFGAHGIYTDDLTLLDWAPQEAPRCLYGFKTAPQPSTNDTADPAVVEKCGTASCYSTERMKLSETIPLDAEDLPDHTQVQTNAFIAGCVGNLDRDPTLDKATINEAGVISQIIDDLAY